MTDTQQRARLTPDERRAVIIDAGVDMAQRNGGDLLTLTLSGVADACRIPTSVRTVKYHFGTIRGLRLAVSLRLK